MPITASEILEAVLDPLMLGDLADAHPTIEFRRLDAGSVLLDFGGDEPQFVLTVSERPCSSLRD